MHQCCITLIGSAMKTAYASVLPYVNWKCNELDMNHCCLTEIGNAMILGYASLLPYAYQKCNEYG